MGNTFPAGTQKAKASTFSSVDYQVSEEVLITCIVRRTETYNRYSVQLFYSFKAMKCQSENAILASDVLLS